MRVVHIKIIHLVKSIWYRTRNSVHYILDTCMKNTMYVVHLKLIRVVKSIYSTEPGVVYTIYTYKFPKYAYFINALWVTDYAILLLRSLAGSAIDSLCVYAIRHTN